MTDTGGDGSGQSSDSQFDGASGCVTCDRANVSNAVHGVLQLVSCRTNDIDSIQEAVSLIGREARSLHSDTDHTERGGDS